MTKRINVLIPVALPGWWRDLALRRYAESASSDIEITGIDLSDAQEARVEAEGVEVLLLENAHTQERQGVAAHIIDCFGDPGMARLQAELPNPVVGVGHAGLVYAYGQGARFAVITSEAGVEDEIRTNAARYGVASKLAEVGSIGISAAEMPKQREEAMERLSSMAFDLAAATDVLILGCTELAGFAPALQARFEAAGRKIAVVNPIAAAVRWAETCIAVRAAAHE